MPPKTEIPKEKSKTPVVPESVLKRRKRTENHNLEVRKQAKASALKRKVGRRLCFKKAETYIREYRAQEKSLIHLRRQAKQYGNYFVEPEAKFAFVIRIRGINGLHPKPRKILQLLRLRQINNGVFLRLNKATLKMLKLVEPYITFGYPNLKSVRELIYKRGFAKVDKQRRAITDNSIIEQQLGKHGIICMEDLVHEIYTVGPHFSEVTRFLWPFHLAPPTGGWKSVTTHVNEGGDAGLRETRINRLIRQMN